MAVDRGSRDSTVPLSAIRISSTPTMTDQIAKSMGEP